MGSFRKLKVWHEASALTVLTYKLTADFPKTELYGLTSQMRRAAVSVTSNIAEGCGRNGDRELARFLRIALGSLTELDSLVLVSENLEMCSRETCADLTKTIRRVRGRLSRLLATLNPTTTK
jgi:four helix bundle protein